MKQAVEAVLKQGEGATISHPDGLSLVTSGEDFETDTSIKVSSLGRPREEEGSLAMLGNAFQISSTVASSKGVRLSVRVEPEEIEQLGDEECQFFLEIQDGDLIRVVSGSLQERIEEGETIQSIDTAFRLPEQRDIAVLAGVFGSGVIPPTFHPVPHQFKNDALDLSDDPQKPCRRAGTAWNEEAERCEDPKPQELYPMCYPAAWARLFGAYRLVLAQPKRQWEMGTPTNPNPSPDENGDYFSTWAMGTQPIEAIPSAIRVEDWHSGDEVELCTLHFELRDDIPVEDAIRERASLIKGALMRVVGGKRTGEIMRPIPPKPVFIAHSGHAWNIVGVETDGYWSHGQNPASKSLSDWCTWENARWLAGELGRLAEGKRAHDYFKIRFPLRCELKPEKTRLGSIGMRASSGWRGWNSIKFVDLRSGRSIDWTPYIEWPDPDHPEWPSPGVGYLWIEDGVTVPSVPLDNDGKPTGRASDIWNEDLGFRIPVPLNEFGSCYCDEPDGCHSCRTRLHLPFWVHNTTKDELHTYKVNLYFWTSDGRWVSLEPKIIQPLQDGTFPVFPQHYEVIYDLPAITPRAGEPFEIQATPDDTPEAGVRGDETLNWKPVAWYVDFHKDQLAYYTIHGVRLVLTCVDREPELICSVQDIKQLWFETQGEPII